MCDLQVGTTIKTLREKNEMTQWDLYEATGLKPGYISKIESEKIKYPKLKTLIKVSKAFNIKLSEFIEHVENQQEE